MEPLSQLILRINFPAQLYRSIVDFAACDPRYECNFDGSRYRASMHQVRIA